jgi:2'-5' RNA ligase
MSVIRAFIAIDLSPAIRQKIDQVTASLRRLMKDAPIKWVPGENTHLTLKFLGDVSVANLEMLKKIVQQETTAYTPFEIRVEELGAFPSIRRPRVIWVKVKGPSELNALQHNIDVETARLGYASEARAFSPHLTLGRVSRSASVGEIHRISEVLAERIESPQSIPTETIDLLGTMRVEAVHLYRSDLRPTGAVYTSLFTASLRK